MYLKKAYLGLVSTGITITLLAIAPSMAVAIAARISSSDTSPTHKFALISSSKSGWGDQIIQLAQSGSPPPRKNPGSSVSGGRRDPIVCPQDVNMPKTDSGLIALSPTTKPGTALAERPSFLVYVPKTNAKTAEFSLRDAKGRGVYRTTLALSDTSGILSLSLPAQAPPLKVGEQYTWFFAIVCDPNRRLSDRFVTGMVQRIEFDPVRLGQIQQAPLREQVALYQKADAWYDTLAALLELQRTQPNDSSIHTLWNKFLQAGGVSVMLNKQSSQQNPR
ncbi:DUF928 domain-containing protein [Phormidium sp. FACHB-592]|uniref:DUF928 domain-containing protein n=1 Tax=Stenomitos frigidus AS-A4 TaxID=2933935 RepID=A0ABV0KQF0_9CYAN|nr:DUF928 domain-containing protein [Phormidium sp. FACHB-592]MBD2074254.1 DUF928 domain-containing protein [Phormidium sp. FACHB-592]